MKKTPLQKAAALLAAQSRKNPTPAQQAASRENGKKGAEHGKKGGRPIVVDERYKTEKVEAYNVAIEALRMHESADPCEDGLDARLRKALANKLDREIDRWCKGNL